MSFCNAFGKCGGCLYQDMDAKQYLQKKENFIKNAFKDKGLSVSLEPTILIPFGTRRRATFAFKKGIIGFNGLKSHEIIPLDTCPALIKTLSDFLGPLKELVSTLKGSGDISVLSTPFGIDMHIKRETGSPNLHQRELLALFADKYNVARILYNQEPIIQRVRLPFAADAFLQPSAEGEKILIRLVEEAAQSACCGKKQPKALDLFCGAGTFTLPLHKTGFSVKGFDIASESLKALGSLGYERDLFRNPVSADELNDVDLIVIDPPRAGALHQCQQISKSNVPLVLMISCNPVTAARDIKALIQNGAYRLEKIIPIDQFVYTNHIELFSVLSK